MVGQPNSVKCLLCKVGPAGIDWGRIDPVGPDRLGPHRPMGPDRLGPHRLGAG